MWAPLFCQVVYFIHMLFTQFSSFKAKTAGPGKLTTPSKTSGESAAKSVLGKKTDEKKPLVQKEGQLIKPFA